MNIKHLVTTIIIFILIFLIFFYPEPEKNGNTKRGQMGGGKTNSSTNSTNSNSTVWNDVHDILKGSDKRINTYLETQQKYTDRKKERLRLKLDKIHKTIKKETSDLETELFKATDSQLEGINKLGLSIEESNNTMVEKIKNIGLKLREMDKKINSTSSDKNILDKKCSKDNFGDLMKIRQSSLKMTEDIKNELKTLCREVNDENDVIPNKIKDFYHTFEKTKKRLIQTIKQNTNTGKEKIEKKFTDVLENNKEGL